jgi:putative transposase
MRKAFLYRLYPNKAQSDKLGSLLDTARNLYNAALQERRDAWKMQHKALNYYDQANELKELRSELPEVAQLNFSATQDMLRRLDKSFKAFFRRIKGGGKAGFPRFKGRDRFDSITFPTYGDGIKIDSLVKTPRSVTLVIPATIGRGVWVPTAARGSVSIRGRNG